MAGLATSLSASAGAESLLGPSVEVLAPSNSTSTSHAVLSGIACTKTTSCVAVGSYENTSRDGVPMIAVKTAAGWARATSPSLPADHATAYSTSGLAGISCASPTACVAVGSYENSSRSVLPMLTTLSAGAWSAGLTIVLPPSASTNQLARLSSVSCVAIGTCTAVGSFIDPNGHTALLAASSTAGTWGSGTLVALPAGASFEPQALGSVGLSGISCTDAKDCVAVGSFVDSAGAFVPLRVARVNGVWRTAVRVALPPRSQVIGSAALDSVSCNGAGDCVAVGHDTNGAGGTAPIVERETHGAWSGAVAIGFPRTTPATAGGLLGAVACTTRSCTAVGELEASDGTVAPVVLVDDSGHWQPLQRLASLPPTDSHARASGLDGVACPAVNSCVGVGDLRAVSAQGVVTSTVAMATRITPLRPVVDPAPPSHVVAEPGPSELKVTWLPSGDGGSTVSSFTATASPGGAVCTSAMPSCDISGLQDGTRYTVVVTATNAHGTSRASKPSPGVVPGTAPGAPTGLGITRSHDRAELRWLASTASPGDPVSRYVATAVATGAPTRTCSSATTSCALASLTRGVTYTAWVVAYNAVGPSARSATRRFRSL